MPPLASLVRTLRRLALLGGLTLLTPGLALAAPIDDYTLPGEVTASGLTPIIATAGFGVQGGEPTAADAGCPARAKTAWWGLTGNGAPVTVETDATTFDTVLVAYPLTGSLFGARLACDGDQVGNIAQITFPTVAGQRYLVQLGGKNSAGGSVRLRFTFAPPDLDLDGSEAPADCDDQNPAIHPGAAEVAGDGIDQDCSGADTPAVVVIPPPPVVVPTPPVTPPAAAAILAAKLAPSSFKVLKSVEGNRNAKGGSVLSVTLSVAAPIGLTVGLKAKGVVKNVGGKSTCAARPKQQVTGQRLCTRLIPKGALALGALPAGPSSIVFTGKLGKKTLAAGKYQLAVSIAGAAPSQLLQFKIKS